MPNWKKLIVSGSNAQLNSVSSSAFTGTADSTNALIGTDLNTSDENSLKLETGGDALLTNNVGGITLESVSDTSKIEIQSDVDVYTNNSLSQQIKTNGQIQFNKYGSGTYTGTAAKTLQVDSSGNVIEGPAATQGATGTQGTTGAQGI